MTDLDVLKKGGTNEGGPFWGGLKKRGVEVTVALSWLKKRCSENGPFLAKNGGGVKMDLFSLKKGGKVRVSLFWLKGGRNLSVLHFSPKRGGGGP